MSAILNDILEKENNSVENNAEYLLKTKFFENGAVDLIFHRIKHRIPKLHKDFFHGEMTLHSKTLTDEEKELKRLENIKRAATRAKQQVQYSIRQIQANHMLTLSTRENIQNRDEFFRFFKEFIRLVRSKDFVDGQLLQRSESRHYPYVAVPELQERGAFHMHMAVVGRQDLDLLRACWYVALDGSVSDTGDAVKGQIDVTSNREWKGESDYYKTMKLVGYLTKYISKSFESESKLGINRYSKSAHIPKVIVLKQYLLACWSNGQKSFVDAIAETISIAGFMGIGDDFKMFNRGQDLFVLRGRIYD